MIASPAPVVPSNAAPPRPRRPVRRQTGHDRAGTVYVAVLGTALVMAVMALAALHAARLETEQSASSDQIASAELLAQSAIELGLAQLAADANWRTTFSSGVEVPSGTAWTDLGAGSVKFVLVDADGDLADDANDAVGLQGIGRRGDAISVAAVTLQPNGAALSCLDSAVHAGGSVTGLLATITTNQTVSSNGLISMIGGAIGGNAWAVGTIASAVSGTASPLQTPAREMPDPNTLFDYYLINGTAIGIGSIPNQTIEDVVLTATNNPYGAANAQGIYVIDTQGQTLRIKNCRLEATLVVISPANTTIVSERIHWEPAVRTLPALLVRGNLSLLYNGSGSLSETTAGVNFNPAAAPYQGSSDSDTTDAYPGVIKGLTYASAGVGLGVYCTMEGTLVSGGGIGASGVTNVTYAPVSRNNPPPGFSGGSGVRIVPGSWTRMAR